MGNFVHRTTKRYVRSGNDPFFPVADWIHNPDLSAVANVPNRYWEITGDIVSEMSQAKKDAVDAALLQAANDTEKDRLDDEKVLRAFANVVLNEFNTHSGRTNAILDAIDAANNLGDVKTSVAAIANIPIRTQQDLVNAVKAEVDNV